MAHAKRGLQRRDDEAVIEENVATTLEPTRAFSRFLSGQFDLALADLDMALMLRPRHVAAMAGRVLTLHALDREDEAQAALRKALDLNPWLPERHLLQEPKGQEL